jgi:hypothetical protein
MILYCIVFDLSCRYTDEADLVFDKTEALSARRAGSRMLCCLQSVRSVRCYGVRKSNTIGRSKSVRSLLAVPYNFGFAKVNI